jgi:hypothetical protein
MDKNKTPPNKINTYVKKILGRITRIKICHLARVHGGSTADRNEGIKLLALGKRDGGTEGGIRRLDHNVAVRISARKIYQKKSSVQN